MTDVAKHSQAKLFPSELVTLGLLLALKGQGERAFYRWVEGNLRGFFPHLPDRTRLMRLIILGGITIIGAPVTVPVIIGVIGAGAIAGGINEWYHDGSPGEVAGGAGLGAVGAGAACLLRNVKPPPNRFGSPPGPPPSPLPPGSIWPPPPQTGGYPGGYNPY